jgi:hypothetical protein
MGELLDRLNAMDSRIRTRPRASGEPIRSAADQAALAFRSASRRVNKAIEAVREPGMPLDTLSRWTRQAPLQALAAAFLVGVILTRRRR